VTCRAKFREEDFQYCTKFGMPETGTIQVRVKAKFLATYKKTEDQVTVTVGMYRDHFWDEVADNKKLTCDDKKSKAITTLRMEIPVDGSWSRDFSYHTENSMMPRIYYFAALDCEHNTHSKVKTMPKIEFEFQITNVLPDYVLD
jgi:hypothetical protein